MVDTNEPERADDDREAWNECLTPCLQVLRVCQAGGDDQAWADLYLIIEESVSRPISRRLRRLGFPASEAQVVVLELIEALYLNDCRRLRSCRAKSDAMFYGWLRTVAHHFTLDWVRRCRHARRETPAAMMDAVDEAGPDELAIHGCLDEWQPSMKPKDFRRLQILLGWHLPERRPAERTRRHWTQDLLSRYWHLFLGNASIAATLGWLG